MSFVRFWQGAANWKQMSEALRFSSSSSTAAVDCLKWLGAFDESRCTPHPPKIVHVSTTRSKYAPLDLTPCRSDVHRPLVGACARDAFSALLQERLAYGPGERDGVFMEHTFQVTASNRLCTPTGRHDGSRRTHAAARARSHHCSTPVLRSLSPRAAASPMRPYRRR